MSGGRGGGDFGRYVSAGPVLELVDRWLAVNDWADPFDPEPDRDEPLDVRFREEFGVDRRQVNRWRRKGRVPIWQADRIATRLGRSVWELWPDEWAALPGIRNTYTSTRLSKVS